MTEMDPQETDSYWFIPSNNMYTFIVLNAHTFQAAQSILQTNDIIVYIYIYIYKA